MSVTLRGSKWQAYVQVNGERKRATFSTKEEAELWELQTRQALVKGTSVPTVQRGSVNYTLKDAATRCMKMHWVGSKSEEMQQQMIEVICRELGGKRPVTELTTSVINDYILDLKDNRKSNGTINRRLACLSKILKTAQRQGHLDALPHLERQKEGMNRIRWLTVEEEKQYLDLLEFWGATDVRDAFIVSIDTGIRFGELCRIKPKHVTKDGLYVEVSKNDQPRLIPLTQRAREVLDSRSMNPRPGTGTLFPVSKQWHRGIFDRAREQLGFDDVVWHTLRHTTCSRLIQGGMPLVHVKEWMGHRAIQTTMRYAHLAPKHLATGVGVLESHFVA